MRGWATCAIIGLAASAPANAAARSATTTMPISLTVVPFCHVAVLRSSDDSKPRGDVTCNADIPAAVRVVLPKDRHDAPKLIPASLATAAPQPTPAIVAIDF